MFPFSLQAAGGASTREQAGRTSLPRGTEALKHYRTTAMLSSVSSPPEKQQVAHCWATSLKPPPNYGRTLLKHIC